VFITDDMEIAAVVLIPDPLGVKLAADEANVMPEIVVRMPSEATLEYNIVRLALALVYLILVRLEMPVLFTFKTALVLVSWFDDCTESEESVVWASREEDAKAPVYMIPDSGTTALEAVEFLESKYVPLDVVGDATAVEGSAEGFAFPVCSGETAADVVKPSTEVITDDMDVATVALDIDQSAEVIIDDMELAAVELDVDASSEVVVDDMEVAAVTLDVDPSSEVIMDDTEVTAVALDVSAAVVFTLQAELVPILWSDDCAASGESVGEDDAKASEGGNWTEVVAESRAVVFLESKRLPSSCDDDVAVS